MELEILEPELSVCKIENFSAIKTDSSLFFIGRTDEELSLVCPTEDVPENTLEREDGWRGFRIRGTLDFSLTGILSRLSGILADEKIGIFAVSTYNTDYILVKKERLDDARKALERAGCRFIK